MTVMSAVNPVPHEAKSNACATMYILSEYDGGADFDD